MSQWLDEDRELIGLVAEDLRRHGVKETGRQGLSAESVLRCGLLNGNAAFSATRAIDISLGGIYLHW